MPSTALTPIGRQIPAETGLVDLVGIDEPSWPSDPPSPPSSIGDFDECHGSQSGEPPTPVRMVLASLGLDASAHRTVSHLADRAIDIRLVTFHGYVHDQEMLLARQVRAADDTRTSSAGPPTVRPETEGHRARSRGDPAGCTRIAGLQCSDVLRESRHHLPAADDRPARWRACPRVALCNDRRTLGKSGSRSNRRPSTCAPRSSSRSGMRFHSKGRSPERAWDATRWVTDQWHCRWEGGGEEGRDGSCGRGGRAGLEPVGLGTGGG